MAFLGLAAILGLVGYMAYFALTTDDSVPVITVEQVAIGRSGNSYVVVFQATSDSAATAASLRVQGELRDGPAVIETAETEIDYLPPFSRRKAGLFFQNDPARYELRLLPKGYDEP